MPRRPASIRRAALLLPLLLGACKGAAGREPDAYEGCGTDENAATFDDYGARTAADALQAPRLLEPAAAAALPAAAPATIRWQPSPADAGRPNGNASCPDICPTCRLQPEHLPPVSGNVYDLRIRADGVEVYRVVTTLQSFTARPAVWAGWAGKEITADLVGAALLRNEVASGPFRAEPLRFRVLP